jgi:hypothetical protein
LDAEVSKFKLEATLFSMKRGKSVGLDNLSVEFYICLFDLMKKDLPKVVCESKRSGKVMGVLNSTFLALIPKKEEAVSFEDFRPISCCNT